MDDNYENWLEVTGVEDSPEAEGWYNCSEDECADYIEDHQEWWNNF